MTDEQKASYVFAEAVSALIELEAMKQENRRREANAQAPAYQEEDFLELQRKYCISHNATIGLFHG